MLMSPLSSSFLFVDFKSFNEPCITGFYFGGLLKGSVSYCNELVDAANGSSWRTELLCLFKVSEVLNEFVSDCSGETE